MELVWIVTDSAVNCSTPMTEGELSANDEHAANVLPIAIGVPCTVVVVAAAVAAAIVYYIYCWRLVSTFVFALKKKKKTILYRPRSIYTRK